MIEEGIVDLVQSNAGVQAIAATGGFLAEVEKGTTLPSWSYRIVSDDPELTLTTVGGLVRRRIEISSYGNSGADAISLAKAINTVLHGYSGTLADADHTKVDSCHRSDVMDFFDSAARTWRRMLEFEIWFYET